MKHFIFDLLKSQGPIALDDLTGLLESETKKALQELKDGGIIQENDKQISLTADAEHHHDDAREKFLEFLKHHIAK